jgi:hypothetical protein
MPEQDIAVLQRQGEALAAQIAAARKRPPPRRFDWLRWIVLPRRARQIERVLHLQGDPLVQRWRQAVTMAVAITRMSPQARRGPHEL